MTFHLTQKAREDLKEIARYTETTWGRKQRNVYLTGLDGCFHSLADMPQKGVACGMIREGYRKYKYEKHVIFFRLIEKETLEIVRVLHHRMDYSAQLSHD